MRHRNAGLAALGCALLLGLAGCGRGPSSAADGVRQTHFPGAVTAGGGTSGEVMARAVAGAKSGEGGRGQAAPGGSVSGTPGIPEGAGGTTSGPAMGATTQGAAGTKAAPQPPAQQERR